MCVLLLRIVLSGFVCLFCCVVCGCGAFAFEFVAVALLLLVVVVCSVVA